MGLALPASRAAPCSHCCLGPSGASTRSLLARGFCCQGMCDSHCCAQPLPGTPPPLTRGKGLALSAQGRAGRWPNTGPGTFEGLPTDLAEVGPALLVAAGHVPQQGPLLREALLAELTAEGPLASVGAVVLVQAGCGEKERGSAAGPQPRAREGPACLTLGAEGLATEVALEGLLACVRAQVHVEIGLLGEGVAAELTDVWPLIPVQAGTQASPKEAVPLVPLQLGTHLIPEPRKQARLRPACLSCENRLGLPGEKRA